MDFRPRIFLEIDGIDELKALLEKAEEQMRELRNTADAIDMVRLELQVKINQPTAATDG